MRSIRYLCLGLAACGLVGSAASAANIIPTATTSVTINRGHGVLRVGSGWEFGSTPSDLSTVTDGLFEPENQQWNTDSFWWDEAASVDPTQMVITIQLDGDYSIDRFIVQADNNEDYVVEYWNGTAFTAFGVAGFGLTTRDSGVISPIVTNAFQLKAQGGDQFYSISEFQAFGVAVPEPATWAMMIAGFGLMGAALRRRRKLAEPSLA